jgi:hypothetical protein
MMLASLEGDTGARVPAFRVDNGIAAGVVAAYLALSLVLLPPGEYPRAIGGALLIFGLIAGAARLLGRGAVPDFSVLAVAVASAAVLAVPTFPAMGGTVPAAVPLGFLGSQAAALLWVTLRWEPRAPSRRVGLREAWSAGLMMSLFLCAIATIPILLGVLTEGFSSTMLLVYVAYVAGFMAAATLFWALQRVTHLATGLYGLGILGGACVYGAMAPIMALVEREPLDSGEMLMIALLAGAFVGPAAAFGLAKRD